MNSSISHSIWSGRLRLPTIIATVALLLASDLRAQSEVHVSLQDLLLRVENHPELEMKRAEIDAGTSRITMRSSLMNPMLILGVQNVPTNFSFNQDPMTGKVIGLGQSFLFPGKLSKEQSIGELSVDASRADLDEKRNSLRKEVKLAWFDILHRQRSITAYSRHLEVLSDIEKEIATSAAFGKTPLAEIQKVELERTTVKEMIAEEQSMIAMQMAKLTYNTGLEVTSIAAPDSLALPLFDYTADGLLTIALENRPLLKGLRSQIGQAEAATGRAELEHYPDFDVMLMYMQRDAISPTSTMAPPGPQLNMVSAQLQIKLPLNNNGKKDALVTEAQAMKRMKLSEEQMARREIRMMLSEKLARIAELRTKYELLISSTLPSLKTIRELSVTDYQFDKSTLQSVAGSELALLHKAHDSFEIESDFYKAIAEIEFLVGKDLIPLTQ